MRAPQLSAKQVDKRNTHSEKLTEIGAEVETAITTYNDTVREARKTLEAVLNKYNTAAKAASQFAEGIADSASNWLGRNENSPRAQEISSEVEDYRDKWREWAEEVPTIEIRDLDFASPLKAFNPSIDVESLEHLPDVSAELPDADEDADDE